MYRQYNSKSTSKRNRCFKKTGKQSIGKSKGGLTTKIHMVAASDRAVVDFILTGGERNDSPVSIELLDKITKSDEQKYLLMDRAYNGKNVRSKAEEKGFIPVTPPDRNCVNPWVYDKEKYKQRNEIERYFLRLKRFRKIFTRYDKLDIIFCGFIYFVMIIDGILV